MQKSTSGFTIVELIVIIVVIGIIAAIAIVSYGNISRTTQNNERIAELRGWKATFDRYKAANGQYPVMTDYTVYCLGTGFPNQICGNSDWTEANSVALMNELAPYSTPAPGPRTRIPHTQAIGPYAEYTGSYIRLITMLELQGAPGDVECPEGTQKDWSASGGGDDIVAQACLILLRR